MNKYFSKNYEEAREKFLTYSKNLSPDQSICSLKLNNVHGYNGNALYTDITYFGDKKSTNLLIHTSGVHGVEGFAGSAIQCYILDNFSFNSLPSDTAVIFIHIVNPYGMSWLRRVNEQNVDLNRNAKIMDEETAPNALYDKLSSFLNPNLLPFNWSLSFYYEAMKLFFKYIFASSKVTQMKYNLSNLKNAIAMGQDKYPKGLFYSGKQLQQSYINISKWMLENFKFVKKIMHIDIHTGLGKYAYDTLLFDEEGEKNTNFVKYMGAHAQTSTSNNYIAYKTSGLCGALFKKICYPQREYYGVTQEFGTYSNYRILEALRSENYYHNYENIDLNHKLKQRLLGLFNPNYSSWQKPILKRGMDIFKLAKKATCDSRLSI